MLTEYSISDIITSMPKEKRYYVGTFEETDNPKVDWPHRHNYYSFVWFTKGSGNNVIDFEDYEIKNNRLFLMQPKQVHNWSYSKGTNGFIIILDSFFENILPVELINITCIDLNKTTSNFFIPFLNNLIQEWKNNDELSEKIIMNGIRFLLYQLSRFSTKSTNIKSIKSKTLVQFSKLISNDISKNISVEQYANNLHITAEKLSELCKKYYEQSPKQIILNTKITEAKRLLYFTNLSIKEIAYATGFEDSSYFSRVFKQKTKYSPSKFKSTR
ncbi:AraC family transcriptional regulator [Aquimarina algiphila]|uniref:Helix-turn-helix domain-containing protein n=1 Tax=Aquimarina algiphila TaxID=2047982 RepID=A0A554VI72_9FLAO|nr:AraC family transcriptional regulator [Aquimarina algiphila]TSE07331.1 helix-turn-helix domain-containing protein [Aquimarina algiphila]